jgi:hypothetical protein
VNINYLLVNEGLAEYQIDWGCRYRHQQHNNYRGQLYWNS